MAKLKEFKCEYGLSLEIKGTWHKLHCGATIEVEEGDNSKDIKAMAWNTVYAEIEKQIADLTKQMN